MKKERYDGYEPMLIAITIIVILIVIFIFRAAYLSKDCCVCGVSQPVDILGWFIDPREAANCCPCPPNPNSELCYHNPQAEECNIS